MTRNAPSLLFLPGASGDANFWRGLGCLLPAGWDKTYLRWPGLGNQPPDPGVNGMADLLGLAEKALTRPSAIVAQSMGGIVAVQLALGKPELVTHLVLTATSGGLDLREFGATDWRPAYLRLHPHAAPWITTASIDLRDLIPTLRVPTLLLWGDRDPISPPAVGKHLAGQIPSSRLTIIAGGEHAMGYLMPERLAPHIAEFIGTDPADHGH
jgi:pimeloyl-ACP methyl ester carboxylesterase